MKRCTKCHELKSLDNFYSVTKTRRHSHCNACRNKQRQKRRQAAREAGASRAAPRIENFKLKKGQKICFSCPFPDCRYDMLSVCPTYRAAFYTRKREATS